MKNFERTEAIVIQALNGQYSISNRDALGKLAAEKTRCPEMIIRASGDAAIAMDFSAIMVHLGYGNYEWRKLPKLPVEWIILGEEKRYSSVGLEGGPAVTRSRRENTTDKAKKIHIIGREKYGQMDYKMFVEFENTDEMVADGYQMSREEARKKFKEMVADDWKLF